jgi:hypothetical protein
VEKSNFGLLRTFTFEFVAEALQLFAVVISYRRIVWKRVEHYHAMDIPPNTLHDFSCMQISFWLWFRLSITVDPMMSALNVDVEYPLLVTSED